MSTNGAWYFFQKDFWYWETAIFATQFKHLINFNPIIYKWSQCKFTRHILKKVSCSISSPRQRLCIKRFQKNLTDGQGGKLSQLFEYSKLFLQLNKWWKVSNALDHFKVALYTCPNHTDHGIHSDHAYLTLSIWIFHLEMEIPFWSCCEGFPILR